MYHGGTLLPLSPSTNTTVTDQLDRMNATIAFGFKHQCLDDILKVPNEIFKQLYNCGIQTAIDRSDNTETAMYNLAKWIVREKIG